jgi:Spy/CpxP family protein refolding chaperone
MRLAATVLLAALLLALAPAQAQDRGWRGKQERKQGFAPPQRESRESRETLRRDRPERREERREQRFTPEEREKLRQDLLDANRDMKRK